MTKADNRIVHCTDALNWLANHTPTRGQALVASLPDISEFPLFTLEEWKLWFIKAAQLTMNACHPDGVTLFFQSDIKQDGLWINKGYLIQKAAEQIGHELLFHKIICRASAGTVTFGRPSYSHLLAFSKNLRLLDKNLASADVVPSNGEKTWARGMGLNTGLMIAKFAQTHAHTDTIVNPFCGEGSMLACANFLGMGAIGIERSAKRAKRAQTLMVNQDGTAWAKASNAPPPTCPQT